VKPTERDALYVVLFLVALFLLDLVVISGILIHGKANFTELYKHLK